MRQAFHEVGWLFNEEAQSAQVAGFALGYDYCSEHEWGAQFIRREFGIENKALPEGLDDRTATRVSDKLGFFEYSQGKGAAKVRGAVLYCTSYRPQGFDELTPLKKVKAICCEFPYVSPSKQKEGPLEQEASKWSDSGGFALRVSGVQNVARLKELHEAFLRKDVCYIGASSLGFLRKSSAFIIKSKVAPAKAQQLLENDLSLKRLYAAAEATGIEQTLKDAGCKAYALKPAWRSGEGSELLFWLNPYDQRSNSYGWFTVQELEQWARGEGPIPVTRQIEAQVKKSDPDWGIHLLKGLEACGIYMRRHENFVWLDDAKTKIGVNIMLADKTTSTELAEGTHPLEQIQVYVEKGRTLREKKAA